MTFENEIRDLILYFISNNAKARTDSETQGNGLVTSVTNIQCNYGYI